MGNLKSKFIDKTKKAQSEGFKFELSDLELTEFINQLPLNNLNASTIFSICEALLYDYYGYYMIINDENKFNIAYDFDNVHVTDDVFYMEIAMNFFPFLHEIIHNSLSFPVRAIQIILTTDKNNVVRPKILRLNEDVKGDLIATCHLSIGNMSMKLKKLKTMLFSIPEEDLKENKYGSHITIFPNYSEDEENKEPLVFWHLAFHDKFKTSMNEDLLISSAWDTEEDFVKRAKEEGISITNRTIYEYRKFSLFPEPYKIKTRGKEHNYFDPAWTKYIKRVRELKTELNKSGSSLKDLRKLDKKFFEDIPLKKKKKDNSKKNKV